MTGHVSDVPGQDDVGDNPARDLLVDCDRAPREGLAWIDQMGDELKFIPLVMFARFIALRHLAIDGFQSAGVTQLGGAREADIVRIMDEESRDHADAALTQVAAIEARHPGYLETLGDPSDRFALRMVDDVCIVNERLQPGKVQQVLGWTKPHYFGDERLGSLPNVLDVADDSLIAAAIRTRIRPSQTARSAVCYSTSTDGRGRRYLDMFLMEKDFRTTPNFGEANMFGSARIYDDGEVRLSPMESDEPSRASVGGDGPSALTTRGATDSSETAMGSQRRADGARRAALAAVVAAVGIGALVWLLGGDSPDDADSGRAVLPPMPVMETASRGTALAEPSSAVPNRFEVPAPFIGTWDLPEGCRDELGTDMRLTIAGDAIHYYESRCDVRDLRVQGTRLHGMARCEGEGEIWTKSIDLRVIEDSLVSSADDEPRTTRVRCAPSGRSPDTAVPPAAPSSRAISRGLVMVDGVPVSWEGPTVPEPFMAHFSFHSGGYENTYDLDCRAVQFRWASNFDLDARRFTANAAGAEWRPLSDSSTKANAAFRAACQRSGPSLEAAAGVSSDHGDEAVLGVVGQMVRDGALSKDCGSELDAGRALVSIERLDLNGDGRPEYIVSGEPGCACIGARRCGWWVYEGHGAGYRQLLDFVEPDEGIGVLRTSSNGYLDLEAVGWAGPEALREVFRFDGSRYVGTGLEPVR